MPFCKRDDLLSLCRPWTDHLEAEAVCEVLKSGWLSTGPRAASLERRFAEYVGVRHAIAVSSGTAALHLALTAMGIGPDDEVLTTPYTFTATTEAIAYTGARPVLMDIDQETLNISPASALGHIHERTRCILPVHIAGYPCDMAGFERVAKEKGLYLLDDAAHAIGSTIADTRIGAWGDASAFSFYATKNLTAGEGGIVTTNNDGLAEDIRLRRLHGISKDAWARQHAGNSWRYQVVAGGFKYNLSDLHAAIADCQLTKLPEMQARRHRIAQRYQEAFAAMPGIVPPRDVEDGEHSWHLYIVRLRSARIGRDEFIRKMRDLNVECGVHFIPIHLHPYYQKRYGYVPGDFPEAEAAYREVVSLPLHPGMTETDVQYVIDATRYTLREG